MVVQAWNQGNKGTANLRTSRSRLVWTFSVPLMGSTALPGAFFMLNQGLEAPRTNPAIGILASSRSEASTALLLLRTIFTVLN